MITKRIIPCLDVRNGRVVKGKNFEGIQDVSDPVEMAKFYNREGADELVFIQNKTLLLIAKLYPFTQALHIVRYNR